VSVGILQALTRIIDPFRSEGGIDQGTLLSLVQIYIAAGR
jgi:hypothetical protein